MDWKNDEKKCNRTIYIYITESKGAIMKTITIKEARKQGSTTLGEKMNFIINYLNYLDGIIDEIKGEVLIVLIARLGTEQGLLEWWGHYKKWTDPSIDGIFNYLLDQIEEDLESQDATITIE